MITARVFLQHRLTNSSATHLHITTNDTPTYDIRHHLHGKLPEAETVEVLLNLTEHQLHKRLFIFTAEFEILLRQLRSVHENYSHPHSNKQSSSIKERQKCLNCTRQNSRSLLLVFINIKISY